MKNGSVKDVERSGLTPDISFNKVSGSGLDVRSSMPDRQEFSTMSKPTLEPRSLHPIVTESSFSGGVGAEGEPDHSPSSCTVVKIRGALSSWRRA
jgi:hypothetical protein